MALWPSNSQHGDGKRRCAIAADAKPGRHTEVSVKNFLGILQTRIGLERLLTPNMQGFDGPS